MRRLNAVLALSLLLGACASRGPVAAPAPAGLDGPDRLGRDLAALFADASVDHAHWAVHVQSLRTGDQVFSLNASRFMVPASNQKLLTAAVAAERLGWEFRFTTRLLATGQVDDDGTLNGDLVVTSDGDPSINPRHPERWRAFDDWAAALRERGVKIVGGRLIGDDSAFDEPGWGVGWAWDNLQYGYGAPPSGLQYHENQVEVLVGPGMAPGARAIISTSPLGSGLVIDHDVTTGDPGSDTLVDIARVPGSPYLRVRGSVAAGARAVTLTASVENPTRFYLTALREALARHGIFVAGGVADADDLPAPPRLDDAVELLVDRSPPLADLVDVTLKWSRNIYAETLLLASARVDAPVNGTRGLIAMQETLERWGLTPQGYLPRDGSGLSRYDYVTADMLTRLLTRLWNDPVHATAFQASLPVAGLTGTLANRMKGTPAEGRIRAKTGTLSNVRALSGYATAANGEPYVFAMLANNFRVPAAEIDAIMERALSRLVTP